MDTVPFRRRALVMSLLIAHAVLACGGVSKEIPVAASDGGESVGADGDDAAVSEGVDASTRDAANDDGAVEKPDAPISSPDSGMSSADGEPTRRACTGTFGSALTSSFGRLDGYVVSVVPPGGGKKCNGDESHVHLQILAGGATYDVAVNVDGREAEHDAKLVGGAWSEGWHGGASLDYPTALGVHASAFTLSGVSSVASAVTDRLASANHISVFCTGYGPSGCHLVHRERGGHDGALVLDPLGVTPHWILFDFADDSF